MSKKTICPNCGFIHATEEAGSKAGAFESSYRRPYRSEAATVPFPSMPQASRETPTGFPSMDTHVRIPLRQAVISGLFDAPVGFVIGSLSVGTLMIIIDATPVDVAFTAWGLLVISGSAGALGGLVSFCRTAKAQWPERLEIYDSLLWQAEEITGYDLNGDGEVGEPMPNRVEVELQERGIPREIETLEIDLPRLQTLARFILTDKEPFSQRTAAKAGISRDEEWKPFRDKLISRRWAKWNHPTEPKQGVSLTPKGEAILRAISGMDGGQKSVGITHPPTPTQGSGSNYERFQHIEVDQ